MTKDKIVWYILKACLMIDVYFIHVSTLCLAGIYLKKYNNKILDHPNSPSASMHAHRDRVPSWAAFADKNPMENVEPFAFNFTWERILLIKFFIKTHPNEKKMKKATFFKNVLNGYVWRTIFVCVHHNICNLKNSFWCIIQF